MEASKIIKIFIAYSRKDTEFLNDLRIFLWPLEKNQSIKIWYDGEIIPGQVWENEIKQALHTAEIFLLLVSANSLASDYFYNKEVSNALERHHKGESIVVPVILKPSGWRETDLATLQALPQNGKPVTSWNNKDEAYESIYEGLKTAIKNIQDKEYLKNKSEEEQKQLQKKKEEQKEETDNRLWKEAVETNSIFSYTKYIDESVTGLHTNKARQLIKELDAEQKNKKVEQDLWERTVTENTLSAYEQYLNEYPNGDYKQDALSAISRLEEIEKKNQKIRPENKRALSAEQENKLWQDATRVNTVSSYEKYLIETRIGLFKKKAQELINQLDAGRKEKRFETQFWQNPKTYWYLLGGLVVIITLFLIIKNSPKKSIGKTTQSTNSDDKLDYINFYAVFSLAYNDAKSNYSNILASLKERNGNANIYQTNFDLTNSPFQSSSIFQQGNHWSCSFTGSGNIKDDEERFEKVDSLIEALLINNKVQFDKTSRPDKGQSINSSQYKCNNGYQIDLWRRENDDTFSHILNIIYAPSNLSVHSNPGTPKSPSDQKEPPSEETNTNTDEFRIVDISPAPHTTFSSNQSFEIDLHIHYNLQSVEQAIYLTPLVLYVKGQFASGHSIGTGIPDQVKIHRGQGDLAIKIVYPGSFYAKLSKSQLQGQFAIAPNGVLWRGIDKDGKVTVLNAELWNCDDYSYNFNIVNP